MKKFLITVLVISSLMFSVTVVFAQGSPKGTTKGDTEGLESIRSDLGDFGKTSYGTDTPTPLPQTIGKIIGIILGLLGVILVIVIIYGGFLYMTSGGDETTTKKGKGWIVNGVIGLVITMSAWGISSYVVSRLLEATIE